MTDPHNAELEEPVLDLEDDEDDDEYLWEDDDWEDSAFPARIATEFPGWHQMKITRFTSGTLFEIKEWCDENIVRGAWKQVGWKSGCSYSVGIVVENARDAMMFKLRWS